MELTIERKKYKNDVMNIYVKYSRVDVLLLV